MNKINKPKTWKDYNMVSLNIDKDTHRIIKTQASIQGISIKELIKQKFN